MAQYDTPAQLDGLFKQIYAPTINDLIPEVAKLKKLIPFSAREKQLGDFYNQPVILTGEQGVTYAAPGAGAFDLNDSVAMTMKNAQVQGYQMALRSSISYDTASRASTGGERAFRGAFDLVVENMMESVTKRLEINMLYGQSGIATASSTYSAPSATTESITMTEASWATGIWSGLENAQVNFRTAADALVSSGADSIFTVTTVNVNTRTVIFTGTSTGCTALNSALGTPGVTVWFNGSYGAEAPGLQKIITNTGLLFNINASTYNLWQGNTFSASSGELTMKKVQAAVSLAVQRGLNEKATVLVNPDTWADLNSSLAALRMFDGSYTSNEGKNGFQSITYYGQNGEIEILAHNCVKLGDAFIVPLKRIKRIGSTDVTFNTPGMNNEQFFLQIANKAGYELRLYTDQSLFIEYPARTVYVSGIVNS